ncbi:Lipopolysaccharide-induced tumor necrosis factor-alpha factor-like protein [Operophtera brumata]|uniref:Lipopolysaccharide-induced tumor necrosis factor-alpha factor-like protein n=1 Tax=Operophtera brumata TaxID=104452 RepID=A0A0L7LPB8_OPEBR|nr:Lipopolysaccharide-induced tumor necrosis factor-alpha factor-like protein [Operophtera brumata]
MSTVQGPSAPSATEDLPPPYASVVGNTPYGFVVPGSDTYTAAGPYPAPKQFTAPGVYPHPAPGVYPHPVTSAQPLHGDRPPAPPGVPVGLVLPPAVGSEPTTINCFNCGKTVTTRVNFTTGWHTHLVAGSVCMVTMICSLCCMGLIPYCFDTFKDAEHYCPNCNAFVGKSTKC